jgi:hypothetical protein
MSTKMLLQRPGVFVALVLLLGALVFDSKTDAFVPTASKVKSRAFIRMPVSTNSNSNSNGESEQDPTAFSVAILGDLHIDPRKMEDYEMGREQWLQVFENERKTTKNIALMSLGDLGESKNCDHNELNPAELFAGTTLCHELAAEYLGSFGVPYEVIGGNHDLEGIDEFKTDAGNLKVFLKSHHKPTPQFCREIAEKTLMVGLCSTVFRDAQYTSHEVIIDDEQIAWFEQLCKDKPASEGWKIFVFTHAPPNGSGLRVLQENHVINGCCWLNHSDEKKCRKFIELVREHRCIKGWFSGHFHLGQDYQDSITFPTIDPSEGPYPNRGSCVFAQTSVIRSGTSRDGRQQSRLLRGNKDAFEICTVDHAKNGEIRVDATITFRGDTNEVGVYSHPDESRNSDKYFKVRMPVENDNGYQCGPEDDAECLITECPVSEEGKYKKRTQKRLSMLWMINVFSYIVLSSLAIDVCWWRLGCGRVLGMTNGMLLEYDKSTLAPLGLVVSADELVGKHIAVIDSGLEECEINFDEPGMEGAECSIEMAREQAVIIYDENFEVTIIQPNEDGSYWRKIVRNKIARMKEKRREKAALEFAAGNLNVDPKEAKGKVKSSWGPYTTTSGVAQSTGVPGAEKKKQEINGASVTA